MFRCLRFLWLSAVSLQLASAVLIGADNPTAHWLQPFPSEPKNIPIPPLPKWKPVPNAASLTFDLDPARLKNPTFPREVLLSRDALAQLPTALTTDPGIAAYWSNLQKVARQMLQNGDWSDLGENRVERYTSNLSKRLPSLALLYAATGQKDLGEMVRVLLLDVARRPAPFWIHSSLRPYNPAHTIGKIETGQLSTAVALAWLWAGDTLTDAERAEVREQLVHKGLDPCLRYLLEDTVHNNFAAVISSGAFITARALDDAPAAELALSGLEGWSKLVENDGSYGEPEGYFNYGCWRFFTGWWAQGREEGRARLQDKKLKNSLRFMVYHYVLQQDSDSGKKQTRKVNFGDDDYRSSPSFLVCESLAYAYNDGLGTWLSNEIASNRTVFSFDEFLFRLGSRPKDLPAAVSPTELKLPTTAKFDNGLAFIRSGWTFSNDILFSLKSGGANNTRYSHDHPNRNSFSLFVDGDYLIVSPGRASYRSPLHLNWDTKTTTANTFTFNGENQMRYREATITALTDNAEYAYLASEAAGAYDNKPNSVLREVWFLKKEGWFVIADTVSLKSPTSIEWSLLLGNPDGKTVLTDLGNGGWYMKRPTTELAFWVNADQSATVTSTPGYLHPGSSYYPGDPGEGKPGTATHLVWKTEKAAASVRVWTLLIPRAQQQKGLTATFTPATTANDPVSWKISTGSSQKQLTLAPGKAPTLN